MYVFKTSVWLKSNLNKGNLQLCYFVLINYSKNHIVGVKSIEQQFFVIELNVYLYFV